MEADAVATASVIIPLPKGAPTVYPGRDHPGRLHVGGYFGDYEFVDTADAVARYDYDGGVPFVTFEAEVPL
jgi:hypothetical protein